ncbi:MAG: condensation domain-containing protein, partial [Gammaproteobacteria bacterium]
MDLLNELRRRDVVLRREGDSLVVDAPAGAIDEALRETLRTAKLDLMELLDREAAELSGPDGCLPLSDSQLPLWYLEREQPGTAVFNIPAAWRIDGDLDINILARAVTALAARHEALRAMIVEPEGRPAQKILPADSISLEILQAPASNSGLQRLLEKEAMRPFELGEGPLVRFLLFRQSAGRHVLLLVGHHLVMDGWSIGLLIRELSELYTAAAQNRPHRLAPPPASYAELMRSEAEWLRSGAAARQLEYWRSRLAGELPVLDMPTDRPRPPARSNQGASTSLLLDPDLCRRLDALARREQGTRLMVIAAAVSALLGRMADQPEVILGMPLANRTTPARAALAGLFMNTVALRLPVDPERDFTSLVRTCRHAVLDALDNQRIPFDRVVEALRPPRDPSRTVVYQALLAFQPEPETGMRMGKLTLTPVAVARCTAQTDLAFWCAERDDGLDITLEYSTDLYTEATARELLNRLQRLLVAVAGDASRPVGAVQLASDADGRRLAEWGTGPAIPLENTSLDRL